MSKALRFLTVLFAFVIAGSSLMAAEFDELEKAPEGAHKGQMLLGAFVSVFAPMGDCIDAEHSFLKQNPQNPAVPYSSYAFENGTSKRLDVTHLGFNFGLFFEYMPLDYLGARIKLRRTVITQRSNFGTDYENWNIALYQDFSFMAGPTLHVTNRKMWDIVLSPLVGYSIGTYNAAPVAGNILIDRGKQFDFISGERTTFDYFVTGTRKKSVKGLLYGAEINLTIYFSGGLFISLGADWLRNPLKLGSFDVRNPQTEGYYNDRKGLGTIDAIGGIVSAGYAFSN